MPSRLTVTVLMLDIETGMDTEQTIAEIEWLERTFAVPDTRPVVRTLSRLRIGGTMRR